MPKGDSKGRKGKGPARRPTARHVLSEDLDQSDTDGSNPESEDDTPEQSRPRSMIRPSTASRKENILKHHTDMVSELSEMFSLDSEEWCSICSRVKMMQCLSNKVMGDVKGMFDLCIALKKKGIINYGEYSKLREILVTCDVEAGETIDKFTKMIRGESEGLPQAKRQRTVHNQRKRHSTEPAQPAPPAQSAYQGVPSKMKYKMESDPRGLCLIINNKKYMTMDHRKGTDVDRDKLQKLFHQLNFKVVIKDDLPGMEMKRQLEALTRSEVLPRVDSLVICLLCHGDSGIVYGTDGVPLKLHDDAFKIFGPQSCPALKGKPKLFVVNSCRGKERDVGTHFNTDSETDLRHDLPQNVPDAPSTTQSITPSLKDLYIAYSTFQGYLSYRSEENGSWFVSKLVEVFSEQASTVEIDHMMREVNKRVADMYDAKSLAVQIPAPTNTLTRQWYFNPVQLGETK